MAHLYPLTFEPILKERVWGGRRLEQLYGKKLPPRVPVGESWEISDRPGDVSVIANGPLAGKSLRWLMETHAQDLLGSAKSQNGRFPLLIKLLDANDTLSLQVHPPPAKAAQLGGEPKTEMWYIAEAQPGAELYVGLKKQCTREEFARKLKTGQVAECFHRVPVRAGDAMFLPSGRVHALGAGLVIFEIQQNSDTTYRVFDWNRVGLDGNPRDLHIQQSLESIDFDDFEPALLRPKSIDDSARLLSLVRHELFNVSLGSLRPSDTMAIVRGTLQIIGLVSGHLDIQGTEQTLVLAPGQFCLIPAMADTVALKSRDQVVLLCAGLGS